MPASDHYEVLGVPKDASDEQIRKAYRDLVRRLHPDVNKAPDAAERFNEVQQAYDTLSDKEKRARYDRFGSGDAESPAWSRSSAPDLDVDDLGSIFETFFGPRSGPRTGSPGSAAPGRSGQGRARAQAPRRPKEPLRQEIPVSFMTAARGGVADLRIEGDGRERRIAVNIPPATLDGAKLRVRKPEGMDRDLILTVRVGEHPHFRRSVKRPLDLEFDLAVSIAEATLGAKISVPTLDGPLELALPAGTSSGQKLRLRGRGLVGSDGTTGDLLGVVRIVPPEPGSLTDNEKRALEALGRRLPSPRRGEAWREGWKP